MKIFNKTAKVLAVVVLGCNALILGAGAASAADMSWITMIHNNSDENYFMTARDDRLLGCLYNDAEKQDLHGCNDDGAMILLKAGVSYWADWMIVPWGGRGGDGHFRSIHPGLELPGGMPTISPDMSKGVYFYQSSRNGKPIIKWKRIDGAVLQQESHVVPCGKSEYELYIDERSVPSLDLVWSPCGDWYDRAARDEWKDQIDGFYEEAKSNRPADLAINVKKLTE